MSIAITAADKHREAKRELRMREHVYPKFVANGTLLAEVAAWQIDVMRAIVEDYRAQLEADPGPLFNKG
jgi:hypothetical protein